MRKKLNKIPRKALTVTMAVVSMIALSSCSGSSDIYGNIERDEVYAKAGKYEVTNGDLWNEFKWSAQSELTNQITNVVLNKEITKITLANKKAYSDLSSNEKEMFENEETYKKFTSTCKDRLVDYVVQDIYALDYSTKDYWEGLDSITKTNQNINEAKYVDNMFSTYRISEIDGITLNDLIKNAGKDNSANYLTIANCLSERYYPLYAKELVALDKANSDADEADNNDTDDDDTKIGSFSYSDFSSKFISDFDNEYNINQIMIRFSSETEMKNTFRAFGIKNYSGDFYFIPNEDNLSYSEYCTYYDKITKPTDRVQLRDVDMIEIYILLYNYLYGGYKTSLPSNYPFTGAESINDLLGFTQKVVSGNNSLTEDDLKTKYDGIIDNLKDSYNEETLFNKKDLNKLNTSFVNYCYTTLQINNDNKHPYSTAGQTNKENYYIFYKFAEEENPYASIRKYDSTTDEIMEQLLKDENKELFASIRDKLILDKITSDTINTNVAELQKDIELHIYNEAIEITYSISNSDYSKTLSGNDNKNVAATIAYDGKTWNFNINKDDKDESSLIIPGKTEKYGVFDYYALTSAPTTAVDLLSRKIIKDTKAYEKTNDDRNSYKDYIEQMIFAFVNGTYSEKGYPSSIGTYNFLMAYFHSANINDIVDNYFRVQYASQKLLTDYSNDKVSEFLKEYTDRAYDTYFSLSGKRLVVFFDADDDTIADDVRDNTNTSEVEGWATKVVDFDIDDNGSKEQVELQAVAKKLVYDIYNELAASSLSHSDRLTQVVKEIGESGRVKYNDNPILVENTWAKYRQVGLSVMVEDCSVTNSTLDVDFNLKQRLYDYARGHNEDNTITYNYYINDTFPTEYIQQFEGTEEQIISANDNQIVETKDGFNLLLVTTGTVSASAKWSKDDHDYNLYNNLAIKYNENYVKISDIFNEDDKLNVNQIKLYIIDNAVNGSSSLLPSSISTALTNFLSPVLSRYTNSETQRIILLYFIEKRTNENVFTGTTSLFKNTDDNDYFGKLLTINRNTVDNYNSIYNDTTGTSNSFPDWWNKLEQSITNFLISEEN